VAVAVIGYLHVTPELLDRLQQEGWASLAPTWRLAHADALPEAYAGYEFFGALVILWVVKGLLLNLGGPAQMYDFQRFLAARDARDAAKVGAAWSAFLVVRWAMVMGIALLAINLAVEVTDPEKFMPEVLQAYLPAGLRGVVIAGLLAAFMSTFSSTINSGASYLVRDLWQPLVRPRADDRHLVRAGYVATLLVVAAGVAIGWMVESIGQIFSWIMMVLGAAFAIPNVLRWYWWRLNGWGYAAGTLVGLAGAIVVPLLPVSLPVYVAFPAVCVVSLVGCLAGTFLTAPTDEAVLAAFWRNVRPFGFWGPVRRRAGRPAEGPARDSESVLRAALNVVLGGIAILGAYLFPMYLVGHWHGYAVICLGVSVSAVVALVFTWYRHLPPADAPQQEATDP